MEPELIIVREYCMQSRIDPEFIVKLEDEGLIEIILVGDERYIDLSQLKNLEQYSSWYYDLSINVEGIGVVKHLLDRMDEMRDEMSKMRERLRLLD